MQQKAIKQFSFKFFYSKASSDNDDARKHLLLPCVYAKRDINQCNGFIGSYYYCRCRHGY